MDLVLTGIHDIKAKAKALAKSDFAKDMMEEIALYVISKIKDRTLDGDDINENPFADYAPKYAEWRKKKGYQSDSVDLTISGHMLSAITSSSSKDHAEIFFMDTEDPTGASANDKAFWNNKDREFFGLSTDDEEQIMEIVNDYYEKLTGRRT